MSRLSSHWPSILLALALALSATGRAHAQSGGDGKPASPGRGDAMIEAYLAKEAAMLDRREFDGRTTAEAWDAARPRLRQQLLAMLGLWPVPARTPPGSLGIAGPRSPRADRRPRGSIQDDRGDLSTSRGLSIAHDPVRPPWPVPSGVARVRARCPDF